MTTTTNSSKTENTAHRSTRIEACFLTIFRILFDVCFFYTLITFFWIFGVILFNHSSDSISGMSIINSLIIIMVFHHILKDRYKVILLLGIVGINITLWIVSYLNDSLGTVAEVAIVSFASAVIALITLLMWAVVHRAETSKLPTYAVHRLKEPEGK